MTDLDRRGQLYLGKTYDLSAQRTGNVVQIDTRDLTTHAVILGMTGSGKTGLGIDLIEEALIDGLPAIIIDPKGDISNLVLAFPDANPSDFAAWVSAEEAAEKGIDTPALAAQVAERWKSGWAEWGITPDRVRQLRERAAITIFTPGSDAGVPVDILQSVEAPGLEWEGHDEELRARISGVVSALLAMVGIEADPVQSREHILLSHLFERAWRGGERFDMPALIRAIQQPPIAQVGVFELDAFFPQKDRFALAASLNNLIASPGFETWRSGHPLDIESLLRADDGRPRASIFYLAHLSDDERVFFVTMLLGQITAWLRRQGGTTTLRALLYFDEIFGYCPPYPRNPPTKSLLLGLIKQARAMGLGIVLATQNPVDLDYKGLANIGMWFIGRLRTERDKARVLDGLESVASESGSGLERDELERALSILPSRVFVLHNVHETHPIVFQSRWAMSFLRGPLTKQEIRDLRLEVGGHGPRSEAERGWKLEVGAQATRQVSEIPQPQSELAIRSSSFIRQPSAFSPYPPAVSPDLTQFFLPPTVAVEWATRQWEAREGKTVLIADKQLVYAPHWLGAGSVRITDRRHGIDYRQSETRLHEAKAKAALIEWGNARAIAVDPAALQSPPAADARFESLPAGIGNVRTLAALQKDFADYLYHHVSVVVPYHPVLKIAGQPGDKPREFRARCEDTARAKRDEEIGRLRKSYVKQIARVEDKIAREQRELARDTEEHHARRREETWALAETAWNFLRGRRQSYAVAYAMRRRGNTGRAEGQIEESEGELADLEEALAELNKSLEEEIAEVAQKWVAALEQVEEMRLTPRRADVSVDAFGLAWLPRWHVTVDGDGQRRQIELEAYEVIAG
ncbi:MAG: helicase HerA domain-containing protein [Anaerolineae bacterium]